MWIDTVTCFCSGTAEASEGSPQEASRECAESSGCGPEGHVSSCRSFLYECHRANDGWVNVKTSKQLLQNAISTSQRIEQRTLIRALLSVPANLLSPAGEILYMDTHSV